MKKFISFFEEIGLSDLASVGGKNSSLGEMYNQLSSKGIKVPYGFATTAEAYRKFISENNAEERISDLLSQLDTKNFSNLKEIGLKIRSLLLHAVLPEDLKSELLEAYRELSEVYDSLNTDVAVRSSATAEDLPGASFAGQHDSFLNISNNAELLSAVQKCFISLFNDRAIKYREDKGFDHIRIAISVGVQKMVRSDLACSGVAFTLEPESGFQDIIHVAGTWGLGENIV